MTYRITDQGQWKLWMVEEVHPNGLPREQARLAPLIDEFKRLCGDYALVRCACLLLPDRQVRALEIPTLIGMENDAGIRAAARKLRDAKPESSETKVDLSGESMVHALPDDLKIVFPQLTTVTVADLSVVDRGELGLEVKESEI